MEGKGINIDGEILTNLRFADNISNTSENAEELQQMLTDLNRESMKIGLKMNKTKTKIMFNEKVTSNEIKIVEKTLEVEEYIYLKKTITDRLEDIWYK